MAIAHAQTPVGNFAVTSAATLAKAYGSNVTAGNVLVAIFLWGSSTQTATVSGSLNGAFTAIATSLATQAGGPFRTEVFYKVAASSGAETITATCSGNNSQREIVIFELSGADTGTIPDSQIAATGSSANPATNITIVAQPGMIVAYGASTAGTVTAGAGYSSAVAQNGDASESKVYSATGSTSVPFIDASIGSWIISAAAFRQSAGGGAVVPEKLSSQGVG